MPPKRFSKRTRDDDDETTPVVPDATGDTEVSSDDGSSLPHEDLEFDEGNEEDEEDDELELGKNPWYIVFNVLADEDLADEEMDKCVELFKKGQVPPVVSEVFPVVELQIFATAFFDAQLMNGGFSQFLFNVKCEAAAAYFTLAALEKLPAPKHAALLRATLAILEDLSPKEIEEYVTSKYFGTNATREKLDKHSKEALLLRGDEEKGEKPTEELSELVVELAKKTPGFLAPIGKDE